MLKKQLVVCMFGLAVVGLVRTNTADSEPLTVEEIESLGLVTFATGTEFEGTEIGGLSGITYDSINDVYYVISDVWGSAARFYTVSIDLSDDSLDDGDVVFTDVTFLEDQNGQPYTANTIDAEAIELVGQGQLFISTEGYVPAGLDSEVNRFDLAGDENLSLVVPNKFIQDGMGNGARDNKAFESLTSTPNEELLYTATETALLQDGSVSTLTNTSLSRLLEYDLNTNQPGSEYVYEVSTIPQAPVPPTAFADNGLVDIQALDNAGTLIVMERSFASGVGNTVKLFEISTAGATDVSGLDSLVGETYTPTSKSFLADFELDLGVDPDNLEGLTFGPTLPDGRRVLIAVSDNNFSQSQETQFVALAVELNVIDFEEFEPADQGRRFGVDLDEEYEGLDWAHDTAFKIDNWGSFTVQDSGAPGGNDSSGTSIPGADGSENWLKARASSVGKGAKITRLPGECFEFESMQLYTQDHPAFIDEVDVTWRTCDATTTASMNVTLVDDTWVPVTASDLGIEGVLLRAMWFNGAPSSPNAAKFGLDNFEVEIVDEP